MSRRKIGAILLVTTGAALLIAAAVAFARGNDTRGEKTARLAVVATRFIPAGTTIDERRFRQLRISITTAGEGLWSEVRIADPHYLHGRVTAVDIVPGHGAWAGAFPAPPR